MTTFITATHDTTRRTTHHDRTRGRINENLRPKLNIRTEVQKSHPQLDMTYVGRGIQWEYTSDVDDFLKFKSFKDFQNQVT
jgi:hypothetical protein